MSGTRFRSVSLNGATVLHSVLHQVVMRGVEIADTTIDGEIQNLVINGVDVGPLVEAELDRRYPDRPKFRPTTADGFRQAWDLNERLVLLKPNLVEYAAGSSINTDPRLVVAAANTLRRMGAASVVVAEVPGIAATPRPWMLASACRRLGSRRRRTVRRPQRRSADPEHRFAPRTRACASSGSHRVLRETELVVSMPKLKTHHWVGVTMSLKNCFGCMPGRVYGWPKDVFHVRGIPESILDIVAAVGPSLVIMDGIVGMEGDGPIMGDPVPSGVVVVARDLVAADVTGARLMGMDPEKGAVPDGGGALPRSGTVGAHAARRGSRAARAKVPSGAELREPRGLTAPPGPADAPSRGDQGGAASSVSRCRRSSVNAMPKTRRKTSSTLASRPARNFSDPDPGPFDAPRGEREEPDEREPRSDDGKPHERDRRSSRATRLETGRARPRRRG